MPLENYYKILLEKKKPKYLENKRNLKKLLTKAKDELMQCNLCGNRCSVNRSKETGFCGVGVNPRVFSAGLHFGEETELAPSATLFFSGCTMRCVYCENGPDSCDAKTGKTWTPEMFAIWSKEMKKKGAKNINLVGGDPTPNIPFIIEALLKTKVNIPIIFNTIGYYSKIAENFLKEIIDLYLIDFRYFDDNCARHLSGTENYSVVLKRNLLAAEKNADLLIRVLPIPSHIECDAKPILYWIRNNLRNYKLNILNQYYPFWNAREHPEISRKLSISEYQDLVKYAKEIGLDV
ncbi:MAG: radical SAM protein [Candidatus Aenigmatarchaeota archaeon]